MDGAGHAASAGDRGQFIPVRKVDILDRLAASGLIAAAAERRDFEQVCRLLGSIYHHQYFEQLERLRTDYFYFNPELDSQAHIGDEILDRAYADLIAAMEEVLRGANFVEIPREDIERAHRERRTLRVEVEVRFEDFRDVRLFRRGRHAESIEAPGPFGWGSKAVEADVYDDVVLLVATRRSEDRSRREKARLSRRRIRPGSVLIKYFRNIATTDLKALFPNARVVMSTFDKLVLGIPAVAGGVPILLNLLPTLSVLFLVAGFYLGISSAVEGDEMKAALAGMSGMVALGGFIMRQWVKYQRQSLKYQKELTDNVYYRNINNNAGIFDYIIGAAEEQECKEAFLAYYFLHATGGTTQAALDMMIEQWLLDNFGVDIDFEADDAVAKLERAGLLRREGERLGVVTPDRALVQLDRLWDDFFPYAAEARGSPTAAA